ncbi:GNAT family N-acetyltransferase [Sphingomonas sp. UYP23]
MHRRVRVNPTVAKTASVYVVDTRAVQRHLRRRPGLHCLVGKAQFPNGAVLATRRGMDAPTLRTERLILAAHRADDLDDLAAMWAHPAVYEKIGGIPRPREEVWIRLLRAIGHWKALGYGNWVLRDHVGRFIGEIGLMDAQRAIDPPVRLPEMGWVIAPAAHGRGYAGEALQAILDWTDRQGLTRTTCLIEPDNDPSLRLASKLGYAFARAATYKTRPILLLER